MRVGEVMIATPADDPVFFALDWRYQVATAAAENGGQKALPPALRDDRCIQNWLQYLRTPRRTPKGLRALLERVAAWRADDAPVTHVVNALLLTEATYTAIAADLPGMPADLIKLYEQSFFNVRTDSGELRPIHLLRIRFNTELRGAEDTAASMLLKAALNGGYALVKTLWAFGPQGTPQSMASLAKSTKALIEQELARRVVQGRMETRDLLRIKQVQLETERLQFETRSVTSEADEAWKIVHGILALMVPELAPLPTADARAAREATNDLMTAEKRIGAQPIVDRGPGSGLEAINERLRQRAREKV